MKLFKKVGNTINSRAFTYISFVLSVCAAVFLRSATWTYGWIAEFKEIIANRQNQSHRVKLIVTALADGAWGRRSQRSQCLYGIPLEKGRRSDNRTREKI